MKRILIALTLLITSAFVTFTVLAACGSYFAPHSPDTFDGGPCPNSFSKTAHWDCSSLMDMRPETSRLMKTAGASLSRVLVMSRAIRDSTSLIGWRRQWGNGTK
jgi:hypothetical protein